MAWSTLTIRPLELSLFGPAPLGVAHMRWEPGMHMAYGVNGAGKSTLLSSIDKLLRGEDLHGDAFIHVKLNGLGVQRDEDDMPSGFTGDFFWGLSASLQDSNYGSLLGSAPTFLPTFAQMADAQDEDDISKLLTLGWRVEMGDTETAMAIPRPQWRQRTRSSQSCDWRCRLRVEAFTTPTSPACSAPPHRNERTHDGIGFEDRHIASLRFSTPVDSCSG
jgi:hypothetical protein